LIIKRYPIGPLEANCYLMVDENTGDAAVLDPGGSSPTLNAAVQEVGENHIRYILLTHGHFDHIGGVADLLKKTNAQVLIMEQDGDFPSDSNLNLSGPVLGQETESFPVDRRLKDGDTILLGETALTVIHTPGHTCGSCCFAVGDALFTGDTLMNGGVGRTDFPTGDHAALLSSLQRLARLPGNNVIYPGHGIPTTLQQEKKYNPYLGMVL
jgi:hydroxyacylglutathione hydrolase